MTRDEAKELLISKYARLTAKSIDVEHSDNCVNIIYDYFEQRIVGLSSELTVALMNSTKSCIMENSLLNDKVDEVVQKF